jgi:hypothetical protein
MRKSNKELEKELLEDLDYVYKIYKDSLCSGKTNLISLNTLIRVSKLVHRFYNNDEHPVLLTYEERIRWFMNNYYETGMEYSILLETMKNEDLNNFKWYEEIIRIPKYLHELNQNDRDKKI